MTTVCSIGLTFLGDRESASPGSLIADLRHDASVTVVAHILLDLRSVSLS
jgi:hypothetical protein